MTVRYNMDDQTWRHSFRASLLSEADIEMLLAAVGFHSCEWLGEKRRWVVRSLVEPASVKTSTAV